MSNERFASEYETKLCKAEDAFAALPDGSLVIFGTGLSEPQQLLWALSNRLRDGKLARLRVFSGPPGFHAADSLCAPDLVDRVERVSQFVGPTERENIKAGVVSYLPHQFHQIPRLISETMDVELAFTTVSPMDDSGHFTLGTNNDFISAALRCARQVVVEVNEHMPSAHGDALLHIRDVSAVVENHVPLPPVQRVVGGPVDEKIAGLIAELVPDGATLQVGSGALPGMVCAALSSHRDLGIHSELMVPGLLDLVRSGAANGSKKTEKPGKHVSTLVVGDADDLALVHDNPDFESYPVSYTNHPSVIARNDRMISINAALQVDLLGQVNAESLGGFQFSGAGGQLDFVRGAYDAKDGKSILAFHATARKGNVSRIVPVFQEGTVVTTPRSDTHFLVTEFGSVDLKGKSVKERALAIIELAHPDFREELRRASENLHLV
ncbi:MAG: acetyl-CoA hydrolase/transferase family protein [Myxococcales bacterium]|nr:acetyl-CoA hydrolase/transferase family protein [Myxococcales bacterium]